MEELSENAKKLFDMLFTTDFKADDLTKQLKSGAFCSEDINMAAWKYVEECHDMWCYHDWFSYDSLDGKYDFGESISGLESSHLLEVIEILLDFGLDPNYSLNGSLINNIMRCLGFVVNGYQTADAVELMLERGGDPNLTIDNERLIDDLDFDVTWFLGGDVDSRYVADTFMHYWMVIVGHGAKWEDGSDVVTTFGDFKVSDFRNHRNYYCGIVHGEDKHSWVSFFDKRTNREVARY